MKKKKQLSQQKITIRNFVAKHAPIHGAGAHVDKKQKCKNGKEKHKLKLLTEGL